MDYMELDYIDYDRLNKILSDSLEDEYIEFKIDCLDSFCKFARIIIDNCPFGLDDKKEIYTPMNVNDSISIACEFFKTIDENFGSMFLNILRNEYNVLGNGKKDYFVNFKFKENDVFNDSEVDDAGRVKLFIDGTMNDIYTIVHEITHKFSKPIFRDKNGDIDMYQCYILEFFLGEVSTIVMEFLLGDYLAGIYGNMEDIKSQKWNRFISTYYSSILILIERDLLEIYRDNGKVNKDLLEDFLNKMNKNSVLYESYFKFVLGIVDMIISEERLSFYIHQKYVIGTCIVSFLHNKIRENPSKIKDVVTLIDILGHSNYDLDSDMELLVKMGIPGIVFDGIEINDGVIDILIDCVQKEVNDCLGKSKIRKK